MNLIVLGADGQIGKALQDKLKDQHVLVCLDKAYQKNSITDNDIFIPIDIENSNSIEESIELIKKNNIKIDGIINLIGKNSFLNFYNISRSDWESSFNVNLAGFLFFLKASYILFNKKVSIVSLASQNGIVAHENRVDYGTFKAAMIHLVKNLTIDFLEDKEKDIKINCISPSYIITENNKDFFNTMEGKKLIKKIPLKTLVEINDVIHAIEFLLSDKSKAIRGQNIVIDYGYTII